MKEEKGEEEEGKDTTAHQKSILLTKVVSTTCNAVSVGAVVGAVVGASTSSTVVGAESRNAGFYSLSGSLARLSYPSGKVALATNS